MIGHGAPSAVFLDALQKPPDFCFDPSRSLKPNPQVLGGHGAAALGELVQISLIQDGPQVNTL